MSLSFTITARNVNDAWLYAKCLMNQSHIERPSRAGAVWEYPAPVLTEYAQPIERVLFDPHRNCNPYFHLFEALWMLAGRNDVAFVSQFNPRMKDFSDDGETFHGAYGYRWRYAFDLDGGAEDGYADQLQKIIRMLKKSQDERRCVLGMWNPIWDLERPEVKDVPCNTQVYFKIREGRLTSTITCRSNDIVWGAYGANVVHFSFLHEYMAEMIGVEMGPMYQLSDSWHCYTERWSSLGGTNLSYWDDNYSTSVVSPQLLVAKPEIWDDELRLFFEMISGEKSFRAMLSFQNPYFEETALPMLMSWRAYKDSNNIEAALGHASTVESTDWGLAATDWLTRILNKRNKSDVQRAG